MTRMRSRTASLVTALVITAAGAADAGAQTADVLFGGWSWRSRDVGSRPAGLAGAYVAVADSVRTAAVNPAGIALTPRTELAAGTSALWAGLGYSLRGGDREDAAPPDAPAPPARPTEPGAPGSVPCAPARQRRPWAFAVYAEQAVRQDNAVEVVRGPRLSEAGELSATAEEIGAALARGVAPWLDLGVTIAWRHVQLDGRSAVTDIAGDELARVAISGDANKARGIVGALATFGPARDPTAFRLGVAYHRDLTHWSVERSFTDRVAGTVQGPRTIDIEEPPVLAVGAAWRVNDSWLFSAEADYIWYERVARALARNTDPSTAASFSLRNRIEPRLGIEITRPSPTGGYYKVRVGIRKETSGRLGYEGSDPALRAAFAATPSAFRAAAGASLLGEFYENGFRLDLDISQVVVERLTSVRSAGRRRLSLGLTVRL